MFAGSNLCSINSIRRKKLRLPIFISGTIVDASGRTLSGQTTEGFYSSVYHANPLCIGLNCALGPEQMKPFITRLANISECHVLTYPNAGLPNEMGAYDLPPEEFASLVREFVDDGLVNVVGGCCGTSPKYIGELKKICDGVKPKKEPKQKFVAHFLNP